MRTRGYHDCGVTKAFEDLPVEEQTLETRWIVQGGEKPKSGIPWITPRMARNANYYGRIARENLRRRGELEEALRIANLPKTIDYTKAKLLLPCRPHTYGYLDGKE